MQMPRGIRQLHHENMLENFTAFSADRGESHEKIFESEAGRGRSCRDDCKIHDDQPSQKSEIGFEEAEVANAAETDCEGA